jgi:outer membrane putative beta-barrel porin/alpha-amylase
MKTEKRHTMLSAFFATLVIILLFGGQALAVDDGARAYWKGRDGTHGVSFQYLDLNLQASDSQQFAPGQYIYANADIKGSIFIANYVHHMTMFNRPSSFAVTLAGGDIDVDVNTKAQSQFVPSGITPGTAFSQSSSGYADPSMQLVVNLFGTPPLKANFDLIDYEPTWTLDVATMLAVPIGEYDDDKLVNMGQNRWFGRIAFPFKYHFGVFTRGYMKSLELIPSVWLFAENDDFMGQKLENDPMWQFEAHLTNDFTPNFFGSLDLLYRGGFQSEIDGVEAGEDLDIGNLGFTLHYQVTDNLGIRTGYSSNVFGDDDLDNSVVRLQFVFGWHRDTENMKRLQGGH